MRVGGFLSVSRFLSFECPLCRRPRPRPALPLRRRSTRRSAKIPPGETRTYREIAAAIGRPRTAHRAVANALAKNPFHNAAACGDAYVPCHRVVSANPKCPDCGYLGSKEPDRLALKKRLREEELETSS